MFGKKKKEKFTLEEYQKIRTKREQQKFSFRLPPWPVATAISVPFLYLVMLLVFYILYVKLSN